SVFLLSEKTTSGKGKYGRLKPSITVFRHHLIPVNKARCPFRSCHRGGFMRLDGNCGSRLGYEHPTAMGVEVSRYFIVSGFS
ncbi:MAG: hypothetical protein COX19_03465, partial [Desulfobacterales bacterium CG23_combo_of_CG06-09_8_20_14_all_51_8]